MFDRHNLWRIYCFFFWRIPLSRNSSCKGTENLQVFKTLAYYLPKRILGKRTQILSMHLLSNLRTKEDHANMVYPGADLISGGLPLKHLFSWRRWRSKSSNIFCDPIQVFDYHAFDNLWWRMGCFDVPGIFGKWHICDYMGCVSHDSWVGDIFKIFDMPVVERI